MENNGKNGAREKTARIAKKRGFNPLRSITAHFVKYIGEGALFWVTPVVTILILKFLFDKIDNLAPSFTEPIIGKKIIGANFAITIALLYLSGLILGNTVGKFLGNWVKESVLPRIPLYKYVYIPTKKIVDILTGKSEIGTQVVLFEPARLGWYKAAIITAKLELRGVPPVPYFSLYEATSPTPNSGTNHFAPQVETYRAFVEIKPGSNEKENEEEDENVYALTATKKELHKYYNEIVDAWSCGSYMNFIIAGGSVCPGIIFLIDNNGNIVKDPLRHTA